MGTVHDGDTDVGRRLQRLAWRESKMPHEVAQIPRVAALRIYIEAVVTTDDHGDAAFAHPCVADTACVKYRL